MATWKGIKGDRMPLTPDNNNKPNRAVHAWHQFTFHSVHESDQRIIEACAHGDHPSWSPSVLNWREQGIMADWCTQWLLRRKPLVSLDGSAHSTLFDMATVLWSSVRGSNQRGGVMLIGATAVHRKEALYGLASRCMRVRVPSSAISRFSFDYS